VLFQSCSKEEVPLNKNVQSKYYKTEDDKIEYNLPSGAEDVYPCPSGYKGLRCIPKGLSCNVKTICKQKIKNWEGDELDLTTIRRFYPEIESWQQWSTMGRIENPAFLKYMENRGYYARGTFNY